MSTELTRDFVHRRDPGCVMWLEEQFGEVQLVITREGHPDFVFRMMREDAAWLGRTLVRWVEEVAEPV